MVYNAGTSIARRLPLVTSFTSLFTADHSKIISALSPTFLLLLAMEQSVVNQSILLMSANFLSSTWAYVFIVVGHARTIQ